MQNNFTPYQNSNGYYGQPFNQPNSIPQTYPNNNFTPYQNQDEYYGQPFNQPNSIPQTYPNNRIPIPNSLENSVVFKRQTNYSQPQPQQQPQPKNSQRLQEQERYEYNSKGELFDRAKRRFIIKVYGLLTLQLIFTSIVGYIGYNNPLFHKFILQIPVIIIVSVGILAISFIISCMTSTFRAYPLPLFLIFTVLMALLVAISICAFDSKAILTAAGITLLLVFALTIFAWKTKFDMTGCGVYLMIMGLVVLVFGIVAIFWQDPIVQLIYSCLGAFLFSIYLIYDTQLIIGNHRYSYSLDDAYLATLKLYVDIIEIFLNILRACGS